MININLNKYNPKKHQLNFNTLINFNTDIFKLSLITFIFSIFILPHVSAEERKQPGVIEKSYRHSCPKGTEKVGDGPPSSSIVFCKQPLYNGSRLEGEYARFYRNGNKQFNGRYERGKKHGRWRSYYRTGELKEVKVYNGGQEVKSTLYKKNGEEIKVSRKTNNVNKSNAEVFSELRQTRKGVRKRRSVPSLGWPRQ